MEKEKLTHDLSEHFKKILSIQEKEQEESIQLIYDFDCHLENSYLILQGRDEIIKSYATLSRNNVTIIVNIGSITHDSVTQTCMLDIMQILKPKALGGVISINMHYILKLQLECDEKDSLYRIVDHQEIPVAQDFISQMPIVGGWYDSSIRNAVGQISMAGSSVLEYTGFLEFAPRAVDGAKSTAKGLKDRAGDLVRSASNIGESALAVTGVGSIVSGVKHFVKWGAASLIEEGQPTKIDCYSPSCQPGTLCYSPTCPRGEGYRWLSRGTIHDIIKGAYTGTSKSLSHLVAKHP